MNLLKTPLRFVAAIGTILSAAVGIGVNLELESAPAPAERTYVGQERCMESCHTGSYGDGHSYSGAAAFRETMHQKIHLRPSPESVIIDNLFEKDTTITTIIPQVAVEHKDTLQIRLFKSPDKKDYFIKMSFSGGGDTLPPLKVGYTYGGIGWIQRFLVEVNGKHHIAPFQYVMPGYRARTPYGGAWYFLDLNRWFDLDSNTGEMKFFKFNSNKFRNQTWEKNCSYCHVNGFDISRRVTNGGADTSWEAIWSGKLEGDSAMIDQNILIGCESCHGPGSEHVASPTKENIVAPGTWAMTKEMTDIKLDLCGACHTRARSSKGTFTYPYDETNNLPYTPGLSLTPFIRSWFGDYTKWPDSSSYAHHQVNQDYMRSLEYRQHLFKDGCWSCHTVHKNGPDGLPYQLDRDWYSLESGEGCISCHTTFNETEINANNQVVNKHTKHSMKASACVNCHFTKTASIAFVDLPQKRLYEFSSHHFKVLRPSLTRQFRNAGFIGMMNSCAESCHRNGRGSRNFADTADVAPDYGIHDANYGLWTEATDLALADSLERHYRIMYADIIGAVKESDAVTGGTAISSVAPNPFRTTTTVRFTVARNENVDVMVYDAKGAFVKTLHGGVLARGSYQQAWDGTNEFGSDVASGTYFIRLSSKSGTASKQVVLTR